jgi:hypothetical protein
MKTKLELIKDIEEMKRKKWELMPKRINAYQEHLEAQRKFNKLWKKERDLELYIFEALQKIERLK